jgi:hypothetical protein
VQKGQSWLPVMGEIPAQCSIATQEETKHSPVTEQSAAVFLGVRDCLCFSRTCGDKRQPAKPEEGY